MMIRKQGPQSPGTKFPKKKRSLTHLPTYQINFLFNYSKESTSILKE